MGQRSKECVCGGGEWKRACESARMMRVRVRILACRCTNECKRTYMRCWAWIQECGAVEESMRRQWKRASSHAPYTDMDEIVELAYSWRITYTVDIQTKRRKKGHIHPATHTQSLMLVFQIFVIKSEHCTRSAKSSNAGKAVQNIGISNCNHIFRTILFRLKIYAKRKVRIEVINRRHF